MKQGEFIQYALDTIGMTQVDLGKETGRTRQAIKKFTSDNSEDMLVSSLIDLLDAVGYDIVLVPKEEKNTELKKTVVSKGMESKVEYYFVKM